MNLKIIWITFWKINRVNKKKHEIRLKKKSIPVTLCVINQWFKNNIVFYFQKIEDLTLKSNKNKIFISTFAKILHRAKDIKQQKLIIKMKKIFLIAVGFFAFQAANAQEDASYKPTTGTLTTEVLLTGGLNAANFDLNGGGVKFRYFLKDDLAFRVGLGLDNEKTEAIAGTLTTTKKTAANTVKLGVEKHFAGTNRLSTYGGADLMLGFGKNTTDAIFDNGNYNKLEQKRSGFGVAVFTGADYYIVKKVYLGVEAGLSFMTENLKDAKNSTKVGNVTNTTTTPGSKGNTLATDVFGGVRLGYQF